ncbi:MAG TPA: thermonuclease family protein [Solirubrobacteraceae bacterium]|nr:thermonuclease family protein [Solirubrobacteraceae bacterium]
MRRLLLLVCAVSTLMGLLASQAASHSVDLDCSDFGFQQAAQDHRDVHTGDPDRLDDDEDGRACEELPCPCDGAAVPPPVVTPAARPPSATPAPVVAAQSAKARVVRVIDGDSLTVRLATGEIVKVRLIGIDARDGRTSAAQAGCGDVDAIDRMKKLAFGKGTGRSVTLKTDLTQDREDGFDRLLAYVSAGRVDLGHDMILSGAANVSKRDFLRASAYRKAQATAKAAKRGVWRSCGDTHAAR